MAAEPSAHSEDRRIRHRVIQPGHTHASVTDKISSIVLTRKLGKGWLFGFAVAFVLMMVGITSVSYLLLRGVGIWGINVPIAWGFAIINFVWWIGIGHAGTFISAMLLLMRQDWRTSINRFAEAMTLFAVACAGIFPLLHLGRVSRFYWLLPYPNTLGMWPQWRSPLVWDIFAVGTYGTISLLFWYTGLVPDIATLRDRSTNRYARIFYGIFALGWRNSAKHWQRYQAAYLLLAALATPLVISVHSVVSLDFATSIVPGWHSTVFPPYFVAGAIFSGFAMVLTLAIPLRAVYGLHDFITDRHLENMAKVMLVTGLMVAYGYLVETFMAYYSGDEFEIHMIENRMAGSNMTLYWLLIACNVGVIQLLWIRWFRTNPYALFAIAIIVNVGMWLERYIIVVTSLHRDFLPSSWDTYHATIWDWTLFIGSLGLFFTLFFLFIRFLPMIATSEMRELVHETQHGEEAS